MGVNAVGESWTGVNVVGESWTGVNAVGESWVGVSARGESWMGVNARRESWMGVNAVGESWMGFNARVESWMGISAGDRPTCGIAVTWTLAQGWSIGIAVAGTILEIQLQTSFVVQTCTVTSLLCRGKNLMLFWSAIKITFAAKLHPVFAASNIRRALQKSGLEALS